MKPTKPKSKPRKPLGRPRKRKDEEINGSIPLTPEQLAKAILGAPPGTIKER